MFYKRIHGYNRAIKTNEIRRSHEVQTPKKRRFELVSHTFFLLFQSIFNLFRCSTFVILATTYEIFMILLRKFATFYSNLKCMTFYAIHNFFELYYLFCEYIQMITANSW